MLLKACYLQGRDANRLLQRSIKAEDKKKRLPKLIAKLRSALSEWELANGGKPFVLGTIVYASEVLDAIEADLEQLNNVKPKTAKVRSGQALQCTVLWAVLHSIFSVRTIAHSSSPLWRLTSPMICTVCRLQQLLASGPTLPAASRHVTRKPVPRLHSGRWPSLHRHTSFLPRHLCARKPRQARTQSAESSASHR